MAEMRKEKDSLGVVEVPAGAYVWGADAAGGGELSHFAGCGRIRC